MDSDLQLLIIDPDNTLGATLRPALPSHVAMTETRRPAQAMRSFEQAPPDLVLMTIRAKPQQTALMIKALKERPLGALVPIILVNLNTSGDHPITTAEGAQEAGAALLLEAMPTHTGLLEVIEEVLGVELEGSTPEEAPPERPRTDAATQSFADLAELFPDAHVREIRPGGSQPPTPLPPQPMVHTSHTAGARAGQRPLPSGGDYTPPTTPDEIRRALRKARHEDYFSLLGVRKSADRYEVEKAYRHLSGRFSANQVGLPVADHYHADLQEIREALEDALAVLGSETLRTEYLRALLNREG